MDNQTGIYGKYIISKADGSPVDPDADYFVLRLDGNSIYAEASRAAAKAYAEAIKAVNPTLAAELLSNAAYADSTKENPDDYLNLSFSKLPTTLQETLRNVDPLLWSCGDGFVDIVKTWIANNKVTLTEEQIFSEK